MILTSRKKNGAKWFRDYLTFQDLVNVHETLISTTVRGNETIYTDVTTEQQEEEDDDDDDGTNSLTIPSYATTLEILET